MHLAWKYGATRLWIVNVGDLKPMEIPISFFLDYAWDPAAWPLERLHDYERDWAGRTFGPEHEVAIGDLLAQLRATTRRRKPELLEPRTYSLTNDHEAETVVADYERLARAGRAALPGAARRAAGGVLPAGPSIRSRRPPACTPSTRRSAGTASTRCRAARPPTSWPDGARALFLRDEELTREYNETLSGGKWRHLMDQTHIGYTYWNQPLRNALPAIQEVRCRRTASWASPSKAPEASWPGGPGEPVLPALNPFDGRARTLEVFNRGREPFAFTVEARRALAGGGRPRGHRRPGPDRAGQRALGRRTRRHREGVGDGPRTGRRRGRGTGPHLRPAAHGAPRGLHPRRTAPCRWRPSTTCARSLRADARGRAIQATAARCPA